MKLASINTITFEPWEVEEAKAWAKFMDQKNQGEKTINLISTKNITGYLCHLAVEKVFDQCGVEFNTTRINKFEHGDSYDLIFENDRIDVKGQKRTFDDKWFFNQKMWVADWHIRKQETHYCFVWHNHDYSIARIFGIIGADEFEERSKPGQFVLKETGKVIKYKYVLSKDLRPLRDYIFRV